MVFLIEIIFGKVNNSVKCQVARVTFSESILILMENVVGFKVLVWHN